MDKEERPLPADESASILPYIELGRLVCRRISLPELYRDFHAIVARLLPARNLYIALSEGRERLRFPYFVDEREPEDQFADYPREGFTAFVLDQGRPIWLHGDAGSGALPPFLGPEPEDWLGVPLRDRGGAVIGLVAVQTYTPGERYRPEQLQFLEFAAAQLSIAIQLQSYDRDFAIDRIAALMDEAGDLAELYEGIHEIVSDLVPAARSCFIIARVDEAAGRFLPVFWRDTQDNWDRIDWPLDRGFSSYIYRVARRPFTFERGRTPFPEGYVPIGAPPYYWVGVPLFEGSRVIGVMIAQSYDRESPVTREDEAMLASIAPSIALAIRRTEFYELTRR